MPPLILIAEDDRAFAERLKRNLGLEGFEVTTVSDGAAALAVLREKTFDLLVTDVRMPEMGGLELLRAIKQDWAEEQRQQRELRRKMRTLVQ